MQWQHSTAQGRARVMLGSHRMPHRNALAWGRESQGLGTPRFAIPLTLSDKPPSPVPGLTNERWRLRPRLCHCCVTTSRWRLTLGDRDDAKQPAQSWAGPGAAWLPPRKNTLPHPLSFNKHPQSLPSSMQHPDGCSVGPAATLASQPAARTGPRRCGVGLGAGPHSAAALGKPGAGCRRPAARQR